MKKAIGLITLLLILFIGGYFYWFYANKYADGYRDGLLQKFSRKGNIFKTYEGELLMSGFGQRNGNFQSQYFYFSVSDPKVANDLEENLGKKVKLHYVQYRKGLPWRGETYNNVNDNRGQYIVDGVEVLDAQQNPAAPVMDNEGSIPY